MSKINQKIILSIGVVVLALTIGAWWGSNYGFTLKGPLADSAQRSYAGYNSGTLNGFNDEFKSLNESLKMVDFGSIKSINAYLLLFNDAINKYNSTHEYKIQNINRPGGGGGYCRDLQQQLNAAETSLNGILAHITRIENAIAILQSQQPRPQDYERQMEEYNWSLNLLRDFEGMERDFILELRRAGASHNCHLSGGSA